MKNDGLSVELSEFRIKGATVYVMIWHQRDFTFTEVLLALEVSHTDCKSSSLQALLGKTSHNLKLILVRIS